MSSFKGGDKLQAVLRGVAEKVSKDDALRVGFLEGETYPGEEGKPPTPVAQVAYWNEYGTEDAPPRPFFRQTISEKSEGWGRKLGIVLKATNYDKKKSFGLLGEEIQGQIQSSITAFDTPGNAPSTIAKKGFDKPLQDTAQMKRAVAFDIKDGV